MLFACAVPLRETRGRAVDLGIVMDLIAENGHRKWAYRAQMVTAVAALVLLGMQAEPALAAKPLNLLDLFDGGRPRLRGGVHPAKMRRSLL